MSAKRRRQVAAHSRALTLAVPLEVFSGAVLTPASAGR